MPPIRSDVPLIFRQLAPGKSRMCTGISVSMRAGSIEVIRDYYRSCSLVCASELLGIIGARFMELELTGEYTRARWKMEASSAIFIWFGCDALA